MANKFRAGDLVRLTLEGLDQGLIGRARTRYGIVASTNLLAQQAGYVSVRRDGIKRADLYSERFWEKAPKKDYEMITRVKVK